MSLITVPSLQDFWKKIPVNRQLVSFALLAVGALASVIIYREDWHEKREEAITVKYLNIIKTKDSIIEVKEARAFDVARKGDSTAVAKSEIENEELKEEVRQLRRDYIDAVSNTDRIIRTQRKAVQKINKAVNEVKK